MLGLVSYVTAKVPPDDAVPRWVVLLVEFLLDVGGNVLRGGGGGNNERSRITRGAGGLVGDHFKKKSRG